MPVASVPSDPKRGRSVAAPDSCGSATSTPRPVTEWHWWRSGWDGQVHAWLLPGEVPVFLVAACGHQTTAGRIVCDQNARWCLSCYVTVCQRWHA